MRILSSAALVGVYSRCALKGCTLACPNALRQSTTRSIASWTTSKEQEAFGLVVERHKSSASENDIRTAFQRFMETAGVAAASEMTTERPPGVGNPGRMDLYVDNTCIEFKTNILRVVHLTQNT